jgi:uncharacterized protein YceK
MKFVLVLALAALSGCSTLNNHGIGGQPSLVCSKSGKAHIDDRLIGSDDVHLTIIRRFEDADSVCVVTPAK